MRFFDWSDETILWVLVVLAIVTLTTLITTIVIWYEYIIPAWARLGPA